MANRKYHINENYFNKIDSEEKAYWLGFIYAEGNVYKNTLSIELGISDKDHLIKFAESVGKFSIDGKKDGRSCRVRFNSKKLISDLERHGIHPNKSRTLIFPKIDKHLQKHFIRGFLDGDGWISLRTRKSNWKKQLYIGFGSLSIDFLKSIQNIIFEETKTKGSIVIRKNSMCGQLTWSGNKSSSNVCEYIYKNSKIKLERKYNRYLNFVNGGDEKSGS